MTSQSDSEQQPAGPPAPAAHASGDDAMLAMLAHLLAIFTWIIGPLVIWLIRKDQSPFVDDHGREALNFQITITIASLVAALLSCLTFGLAPLAVWVFDLVFCIVAAVAAQKGQWYRYPVCIRLIR